jgi:hypothetical protein
MFEIDYDDEVTVLRPKKGTLGVGGAASLWEEVLDENDEPVIVECAFEERGRRLVTEKGAEVQADATMDFIADAAPEIEKGDVVLTEDGRAFEVLELQRVRLRGSSGFYAQAGLKFRKDLPQEESP